MASRTVALMIRYRDADGQHRRGLAARGRNGRVKPGYAMLAGQAVAVDGRGYDLRLYENRQAKYVPAGDRAADADAARARMERMSTARVVAEEAGLKVAVSLERVTLAKSAVDYIRDAEQRGAMEAAEQARLVTAEFAVVIRKTFVDEVTRDDFYRFHAALKKRGCADRTVANKHARLKSWLRFAGVVDGISPPTPRHDQELPTIYSRDQVSSILGAADGYMRVVIGLALKCGLREQEIVYLESRDVDKHAQVLRVRSKPAYGHRVKDAEERDIPIPDDLAAELASWNEDHAGPLVTGTKRNKPNGHLLRILKRLAKQEKLNCGECAGCRSELGECQEWTLHKFRRTYCTSLLRSGMDLRTVQAFMGHADLASTMRYLRPAGSKEVQARLNAVQWG